MRTAPEIAISKKRRNSTQNITRVAVRQLPAGRFLPEALPTPIEITPQPTDHQIHKMMDRRLSAQPPTMPQRNNFEVVHWMRWMKIETTQEIATTT